MTSKPTSQTLQRYINGQNASSGAFNIRNQRRGRFALLDKYSGILCDHPEQLKWPRYQRSRSTSTAQQVFPALSFVILRACPAMPLTILTDSDVRALLLSLEKKDIEELKQNLIEALHEYSTGNQDDGCSSTYQPLRTVIQKKDGLTTLFMPASSRTMTGVKIVSLAEDKNFSSTGKDEHPAATPESPMSSKSGPASTVTSQLSGVSLSPVSTISASSVDIPSFRPPSTIESAQSTSPRGTVTLLDSTGTPKALINAEELTAFRTALAATALMVRRTNVDTITVFGAGKQAYWHIRLALMLRGHDIHHVNIINRSFDRCTKLMTEFYDLENSWLRTGTKFSALSSEFGEYGRLLKEQVRKADVIFCCTPSTDPLFPAEFLISHEGRRKGRYISAIGSCKPHMIGTLPPLWFQDCADISLQNYIPTFYGRLLSLIMDAITINMLLRGVLSSWTAWTLV